MKSKGIKKDCKKWIGPPKMMPVACRPMTDDEKMEEYLKGERNAWKYAYLHRRLEVGL